MNAFAPTRIADEISLMRSVPSGIFLTAAKLKAAKASANAAAKKIRTVSPV